MPETFELAVRIKAFFESAGMGQIGAEAEQRIQRMQQLLAKSPGPESPAASGAAAEYRNVGQLFAGAKGVVGGQTGQQMQQLLAEFQKQFYYQIQAGLRGLPSKREAGTLAGVLPDDQSAVLRQRLNTLVGQRGAALEGAQLGETQEIRDAKARQVVAINREINGINRLLQADEASGRARLAELGAVDQAGASAEQEATARREIVNSLRRALGLQELEAKTIQERATGERTAAERALLRVPGAAAAPTAAASEAALRNQVLSHFLAVQGAGGGGGAFPPRPTRGAGGGEDEGLSPEAARTTAQERTRALQDEIRIIGQILEVEQEYITARATLITVQRTLETETTRLLAIDADYAEASAGLAVARNLAKIATLKVLAQDDEHYQNLLALTTLETESRARQQADIAASDEALQGRVDLQVATTRATAATTETANAQGLLAVELARSQKARAEERVQVLQARLAGGDATVGAQLEAAKLDLTNATKQEFLAEETNLERIREGGRLREQQNAYARQGADAERRAAIARELDTAAAQGRRPTGYQRLLGGLREASTGTPTNPLELPTFGQQFAQRFLTTAQFAASAISIRQLSRGITEVVTSAQDLQVEFTFLQRQLDAFGKGDQVDQVKAGFLEIARTSGISGTEVAQVGREILAVYHDDIPKALHETKAAIEAAVVSGLPQKEIVDSLTAASIAFGVSIQDISDKAVGLEQRFGVASADTLKFFGDIADTAAQSGASLDELGAMVGVIQQRLAIGGAQAAENLSRIFSSIQQNYGKLLDKFAESPTTTPFLARMQQAILQGQPIEVLRTVADAWSVLDSAQQKAVAHLIGSDRQYRVLLALLPNLSAAIDQETNRTNDSGKTQDLFSAKMNTLRGTLSRLGQEFTQVGTAIFGAGLGDAITALAGAFIPIVGTLRAFVGVWTDINKVLHGIPAQMLGIVAAVALLEAAFRRLKAVKESEVFAQVTRLAGPREAIEGEAAAVAGPGILGRLGSGRLAGGAGLVAGDIASTRVGGALVEAGQAGLGGLRGLAGGAAGFVTAHPVASLVTLEGAIYFKQWLDRVKASEDKYASDLKAAAEKRSGLTDQFAQDLADALKKGDDKKKKATDDLATQGDSFGDKLGAGVRDFFDFSGDKDRGPAAIIDRAGERAINAVTGIFGGWHPFHLGPVKGTKAYEQAHREEMQQADQATVYLQAAQQTGLIDLSQVFKNDKDRNAFLEKLKNGDAKATQKVLDLITQALKDKKGKGGAPDYSTAVQQIFQQGTDQTTTAISDDLGQIQEDYKQGRLTFDDYQAKVTEIVARASRALTDPATGQLLTGDALKQAQDQLKTALQGQDTVAQEAVKRITQITDLLTAVGQGTATDKYEGLVRALQVPDLSAEQKSAAVAPLIQSAHEALVASATNARDAETGLALLREGWTIDGQTRQVLLDAVKDNPAAYAALVALLGPGLDTISATVQDLQAAQDRVLAQSIAGIKLDVAGNKDPFAQAKAAKDTAQKQLDAAQNPVVDQKAIDTAQGAKDSADAAVTAAGDRLNQFLDTHPGADPPLSLQRTLDNALEVATEAGQHLAAVMAANKPDPAKVKEAQAAVKEADAQTTEAQQQLDALTIEYNRAKVGGAGNVLQDAQDAKDRAKIEALYAQGPIAKMQAEIDRLKADRQGEDAIRTVAKSRTNLLIAMANAAGDEVKAAELAAKDAASEYNRLKNDPSAGPEVVNDALAQAKTTADAAAAARVSNTKDLVDFQLQMGEITAGQAISQLQALLASPDVQSNKKRVEDIRRAIKSLQDQVKGDLQFNIGDIKLPTLYEVRRTAGSYAAGVGYMDNRVVTVNINAYNAADLDGAVQLFSQAVNAPSRYGTAPRIYPGLN